MKIEAYEAALKSVENVLRCQKDNVKAIYRKSKVINPKISLYSSSLYKFFNLYLVIADCHSYGQSERRCSSLGTSSALGPVQQNRPARPDALTSQTEARGPERTVAIQEDVPARCQPFAVQEEREAEAKTDGKSEQLIATSSGPTVEFDRLPPQVPWTLMIGCLTAAVASYVTYRFKLF